MQMNRPFEGIRVLDSTYVIAFPYAASIMSDLGAEVIKIEGPAHVDPMRAGTAEHAYPNNRLTEDWWNLSAEYHTANRGKKSLVIDLNNEKGRAVFVELVKKSDIVMENFTPRVMKRWGLDYPNLRKIAPRVIMASLTGYGHGDGPYSSFPAQATSQEAMHGHVQVTGYRDGPPSKAGMSFVDYLATWTFLFAVSNALHHRLKTGEGQWIDIAMYQAGCMLVGEHIEDYISNGRVAGRIGNRHPFRAPQGVYRAQGEDEWIAISVGTDEQWRALCALMGRPELGADERYEDGMGRMERHDEIDRLLHPWTAGYEKYDLMQLLQEAGIPAGPVLNSRDVYLDPQYRSRGFMERVAYPPERKTGERLIIGRPWKFSNIKAHIAGPAPAFGQDNVDVLTRLAGLDIETIRGLEAEGIIATKPNTDRHKVVVREEEWVRHGTMTAWDMDYMERLGQRAE